MTYSEEDIKRAVETTRQLLSQNSELYIENGDDVVDAMSLPKEEFYEMIVYYASIKVSE